EIVQIEAKHGGIGAPAEIVTGGECAIGVRGVLRDGRRVLLLGGVAHVTTTTPSVCTTPSAEGTHVWWVVGDGATAVRAVAPGACALVAVLGSLSAEAAITVQPKPEQPSPSAPSSSAQPSAAPAPSSSVQPSAAPAPH